MAKIPSEKTTGPRPFVKAEGRKVDSPVGKMNATQGLKEAHARTTTANTVGPCKGCEM